MNNSAFVICSRSDFDVFIGFVNFIYNLSLSVIFAIVLGPENEGCSDHSFCSEDPSILSDSIKTSSCSADPSILSGTKSAYKHFVYDCNFQLFNDTVVTKLSISFINSLTYSLVHSFNINFHLF